MTSARLISFLFLTLAISASFQFQLSFSSSRKIPRSILEREFSNDKSSSSSSSCWDSINEVEGCQDEIYMSLKSNEIELGYECCKVILQGLLPNCAAVISSGGEFSPEFGGAVNEYCDGMGITPPSPEEEDKDEQR